MANNNLIVAVYVGAISDRTLIMATTNKKLTTAVLAWINSCDEIECEIQDDGEMVPFLRTGTDDATVISKPLTALRLSIYRAKHDREFIDKILHGDDKEDDDNNEG